MVALIVCCPCNLVYPFWHAFNGLYSYLLLTLQHDPYLLSMNIAVLPVLLLSKLLAEMEVDETMKRE